MNCFKCASPGTVILRKQDPYCESCFLTTTNHKFRACIGKNKILSKNEKVLLCISGGPGSSVLLDLVHYGISLDIHKKLRIIPYVLHIADGNDSSVPNFIKNQFQKYNFNGYFAHISDYLNKDIKLPETNVLPEENNLLSKEFQGILKSLPSTACYDFVTKVKRNLFIRYAQLLECNYVFTAETTSTLAINLLSNLAIGRGSQVENDIGFIDSRDKNVKILRPMKDISEEELNYYIKLKALCQTNPKNNKGDSLQAAISSFITDLQENFQSTVTAVCRTADKIGFTEHKDEYKKCAICESSIRNTTNNLSALDATSFSRAISHGNILQETGTKDEILFPYVNTHLCYSCSRNYSEMKHTSPCLQNIIYYERELNE